MGEDAPTEHGMVRQYAGNSKKLKDNLCFKCYFLINIYRYGDKMKTKDIITEIEKLPVKRRLLIAEQILKSIRDKGEEMEDAAGILEDEYCNNDELTAFTVLDTEEFYETR